QSLSGASLRSGPTLTGRRAVGLALGIGKAAAAANGPNQELANHQHRPTMIGMAQPDQRPPTIEATASPARAGDGEGLPPTNHVHVWQVALADVPSGSEQLAAILSPGEQQQAARFAFPHLTRRFATGRLALRYILASY